MELSFSNLSLQSIMQYETEKKSPGAAELEASTELETSKELETSTDLDSPMEKPKEEEDKEHKSERKDDEDAALSPSKKSKRKTTKASATAVATVKLEEPGSFRNEVDAYPLQSGKTKRTVAVTASGAVAVKAPEPDSFITSRGAINEDVRVPDAKSKRTVAATSPGVVAVKVHEPDLFTTSMTEEVQVAPPSSPSSKPKRTVAAISPGTVAIQDKKSEWESFDDPEKSDAFKNEDESEPFTVPENVEDRLDHWDAFADDDDKFADDKDKKPPVDEDRNTAQDLDGIDIECPGTSGGQRVASRSKGPDVSPGVEAWGNQGRRSDLTEERCSEEQRPNVTEERSSQTQERVFPGAVRVAGIDKEEGYNEVDPENVEDRLDHWDASADDEDEFVDDENENLPIDELTSEDINAQGVSRPPDVEYGQMPRIIEGLAMATAVEGEDSSSLPAAIEYDPHSKPPLVCHRRFRLYALVGAILLIAVVAGVVVGVVNKESSGPQEPTPAPTTLLEKSYRDKFVVEVGEQVNEPGSPHDRAAQWIMGGDPLALSHEAPNLIQRYHLALLYYLTTQNGKEHWNSCNPPSANENKFCTFQDIDWDADYSFYVNIPNQIRWMAGVHECKWRGISCDPALNVVKVDIVGQNMTGPLPTELAKITYLQEIAFYSNQLTGTIPEVYASMRHLLSLQLQDNKLTGTIPDIFWDANSLQYLDIGLNFLNGTVSTEIGKLTILKGLLLYNNYFEGQLPNEIGNLGSLSSLHLDQNDFVGAVPTEMGRLTLLQELWLSGNRFEGTIPSEFGLMKDLRIMKIQANAFMGTIPEAIYDLTQMFHLDVISCRLTGTLSTKIGQLSKMEEFYISRNQMSGSIPQEIGNLTSLVVAWLHLNNFTGAVPETLCQLSPDPLQILQADCGPTGNPAQECLCCLYCCDRDTQVCQ